MSDDLSPRERRAQQAKKSGPKLNIQWSKLIVPAVVVAFLGLVFGMVYLNATGEEKCPGHWHSTYHVYVHDERISYNHPGWALENSGTPFSHHLHEGEGGMQIHWEPRPAECQPMDDFLDDVDTHLSSGQIVLEGLHEDLGQAGVYRNGDGNGTLKTYIAPNAQDGWREISVSKFLDRQPKDGERALIVFGDPSPERLKEMQDGVPFPPASRDPSQAQHA